MPGPAPPPSSKDSDPLISPRESQSAACPHSPFTHLLCSGQGGREESDKAQSGKSAWWQTVTPADGARKPQEGGSSKVGVPRVGCNFSRQKWKVWRKKEPSRRRQTFRQGWRTGRGGKEERRGLQATLPQQGRGGPERPARAPGSNLQDGWMERRPGGRQGDRASETAPRARPWLERPNRDPPLGQGPQHTARHSLGGWLRVLPWRHQEAPHLPDDKLISFRGEEPVGGTSGLHVLLCPMSHSRPRQP